METHPSAYSLKCNGEAPLLTALKQKIPHLPQPLLKTHHRDAVVVTETLRTALNNGKAVEPR